MVCILDKKLRKEIDEEVKKKFDYEKHTGFLKSNFNEINKKKEEK